MTFKVNELWDQFGLQEIAPEQQEESLVEADSSPPGGVPVSGVRQATDEASQTDVSQTDVSQQTEASQTDVPQATDGGEE